MSARPARFRRAGLRLGLAAAAAGLLSGAIAAAPLSARPRPPAQAPLVVVLGDSIAAGLGLPRADALPAALAAALRSRRIPVRVVASAVSGDTAASALDRLDFSLPPGASVCVVELGGNDYLAARPPAALARDLTALVRRIQARRIRVVLAGGAAPAGAGPYGRAFDAVYPQVARRTGARLVRDVLGPVLSRPGLRQADGLHPNAAGVREMAAVLAPAVAAALAGGSPGGSGR